MATKASETSLPIGMRFSNCCLDNRPPPGSMTESNINDFIEDDDQEDMFE
jgi:hypothetical protein